MSTADNCTADVIADSITVQYTPDTSDKNIIYYVSGYIARSIIRTTKCDDCRECLVTKDKLETTGLDLKKSAGASTFLDDINRGGPLQPTEFTFSVCLFCWQIYEEIRKTKELLEKFLQVGQQRQLFASIVERINYKLDSDCQQPNVDVLLCVKGHDLNLLICQRLFNCFAKNLVKDITNRSADCNDRDLKKRRKIAKLSSAAGPSQH